MHRRAAGLALAAISGAAPKIPPTRPEVLGVFPHGGQCGAEVDVLIRGRNLQGASHILSATPKLFADILSVEHNAIRARSILTRRSRRVVTISGLSLRTA